MSRSQSLAPSSKPPLPARKGIAEKKKKKEKERKGRKKQRKKEKDKEKKGGCKSLGTTRTDGGLP